MRIFYTLCIVANILIAALMPKSNQEVFPLALHNMIGWTAALIYFLSYSYRK
jgi:hypothetical protein